MSEPAAAAPHDLRGRKLGEFVLRESIGEGGFAAVYRCEQALLGREAVIKVLHHRLRASEQVLQRFLREAQLASRLDHPYAAHVYAFGVEPDGLVWIAMELVSGVTLDGWLAEHGPLPGVQLVELFHCIAEVVHTAHERGIVHRDLKPSNIMVLERAGRLLPKLLDFGIAKLVDDAAHPEPSGEHRTPEAPTLPPSDTPARIANPQLTEANMTLGSPSYMSPEQWLDPRSVGPASDLYSLGIMAFEALSGRLPFVADTMAGLAHLHCTAEVPALGPGFPPALDRVFQRVLAKMPDARPANAVAFVDELRAALASEAAPAPRRTPAWLVASVAAVIVAAAAAIVGVVVFVRDDGGSADGDRPQPTFPTPTAATAGGTPTTPATTATAGGSATTPATTATAGGTATTTAMPTTATTGGSATTTAVPTAGGSATSPKSHKPRHKPTPAPAAPPPEDLGVDRL